jgi:APA family basic amino acid/polyamine antiporter
VVTKRLLMKKSVADLQAESGGTHLSRTLGPVSLIGLGIGCIVGAGIFVLTGHAAAEHAGPAITLSFVMGAVVCALAGLCYAEFAALLPISGSAYTYAYATLGEVFAWIIGWDLVIEYALSASTVAVGWSGYMVSLLHGFGLALPPELTASYGSAVKLADGSTVQAFCNLPAVLIVLLLSLLLMVGVKESNKFNNIIVVIKVAVILAFLGFGVWHVDSSNWTPFIPEAQGDKYGLFGVLRGAGVIFFAYIGFDAVSTAAQEAKNPQRDMPIGILGSMIICTILYILVSLVLTGVVNYRELNVPDPIAVGIDKIGLGWLAFLVKLGGLAGLTSVILVSLYGQTRIFYAMSRDGLLPGLFGKVHPRFKTPFLSTAVLGTFVAVVAGIAPLNVLGELVSIGTLFAFAVVSGGVLVLRYRHPELERPFRCPGVPYVPLAAIGACIYLMYGLPADTWIRLFAWLGLGLLIYFGYGWRHSRLAARNRETATDGRLGRL